MAMQLGARRPVTEINVTPLIDVVLVLLIIFMVLTPLAEKQKYLRVPETQDDRIVLPENPPPEQLILTALENGRVKLGSEELAVGDAMQKLEAAYRGHPSKPLFFAAEDHVRYDEAFHVLDAAHHAGVNTIGIMTEVLTAAPSSQPRPEVGVQAAADP
jgi:biopolymer transport protein ExbD